MDYEDVDAGNVTPASSTVRVEVNGHTIQPVISQFFGKLYAVSGTNHAFETVWQAIAYAESLPAPTLH